MCGELNPRNGLRCERPAGHSYHHGAERGGRWVNWTSDPNEPAWMRRFRAQGLPAKELVA